MDMMGAMNSLRDEATLTARASKAAHARRNEGRASEDGNFTGLLAGIVMAPLNPTMQQNAVTPAASQTFEAISPEVNAPANALPAASPSEQDIGASGTTNPMTGPTPAASAATDVKSQALATPATPQMTDTDAQTNGAQTSGAQASGAQANGAQANGAQANDAGGWIANYRYD